MITNHELPSQTVVDGHSQSEGADKLRELIAKAGLSQRGAARELGIDERTLRYWCAGKGKPPPMALHALDPKIRHRINLTRAILADQQQIDLFESGTMTVGYGPKSGDASNATAELRRLRLRMKETKSLLRQDVTFERYQSALFAINGQSLPYGSGMSSDESVAELEAAHAEWREAEEDVERIVREIRAGLR